MKWKIGNVKIDNQVVLAPMAGICDSAFRKIAKSMGCGLIGTEMVSAKSIMYDNDKTKEMLYMTDEERPIAQQIFGAEPESFKIASKYIHETMQPDIIDINMGCPVTKVAVKSQSGSALLKNPEKIEDIVKNVIEKHFKENFDGEVEEVKFNSVKVYTKEEIEKDEMLKELELKDKDVAFEIDYELRIKEGTEDLMRYTAATGEIEGQWIKEKYNCGVARYDSEKAEYSLSDFGTSF